MTIDKSPQDPVQEFEQLLLAVKPALLKHISRGHESAATPAGAWLTQSDDPAKFAKEIAFAVPEIGEGPDGLTKVSELLFDKSVNTWDQKFMHKLSSATNPVGIIAEMILGTLNANTVVFDTSPVLTTIEKVTARALAERFGFDGEYAGGICQPGGSTSNLTAVHVARQRAVASGHRDLVLFTSDVSHFSLERAAIITGLGPQAICKVPSDERGRMKTHELRGLIREKRKQGYTPFFVNATAGTTVYGAYDPLTEIGEICQEEDLWFHIDGSWGAAVIFSEEQRFRLTGSEFANSITMNPHKMLGVPLTCSFLLTNDMRTFHAANKIEASYLFHMIAKGEVQATNVANGPGSNGLTNGDLESGRVNGSNGAEEWNAWDMADLTLQCGRRGDALKMALSWVYYGAKGFGERVDSGYGAASWTALRVKEDPNLLPLFEEPPECLQVCFYYAPGKQLGSNEVNSARTITISDKLRQSGYSLDYSLGNRGYFFRAVIHPFVRKEIIVELLESIVRIGESLKVE